MTITLYKRTACCCPKEQYKGANLYDYHLNHPHGLVNALTPTLSKKREENGNKIRNTRTTVGTRLDRVRD